MLANLVTFPREEKKNFWPRGKSKIQNKKHVGQLAMA
jgi:hypothetical protein